MSKGIKISSLAPKGGFPNLPLVKGVSFSAYAAGVKYKNRMDTMLVTLSSLS